MFAAIPCGTGWDCEELTLSPIGCTNHTCNRGQRQKTLHALCMLEHMVQGLLTSPRMDDSSNSIVAEVYSLTGIFLLVPINISHATVVH